MLTPHNVPYVRNSIRDVFPHEPSWANKVSWPFSSYVSVSHLLCHPNLLHKQAGTLTVQACAPARHRKVLARRTACDDVHRRQFSSLQFCDIPDMLHIGEPCFCHLHGKFFDFTGPKRGDAIQGGGKGKTTNPIEKGGKGWGGQLCFHDCSAFSLASIATFSRAATPLATSSHVTRRTHRPRSLA